MPVITNSVTPTSSGTSVVTGSVQYLDVGLTLEVEPTIYLDGDVAIKVDLEVSTIVKEVRTGGDSESDQGTLAYEIGTRNANTLLRLKDGETQILAGLIQDRDTQSSSHIPGLGDIPIVGRLFGSMHKTNDKTEIVLSITPRIIRSQPRPASRDTEFWYGTESSVRSAPLGAADPAAESAAEPQPVDGDATPVVLSEPSDGAAPGQQAAVPAPVAPTTSWVGPGEVKVGQDFDVTLKFDGGGEMKGVRTQIRYEPGTVQLVSAEAGDVVPDDARASAVPRVNQVAGVVQLVANASGDATIHGTGSLLVLHFKALAPSAASKITMQVAAIAASGVNVPPAAQAPFVVVVTP